MDISPTGQFAYETARVLHTYGRTDRRKDRINIPKTALVARQKSVGRRNQLLDMRNVKYPK